MWGGRVLGVEEKASAAEIKAAYRAKALRLHPDVSDAPDATKRFAELSHAYGEPWLECLESFLMIAVLFANDPCRAA